MTLTSLLVNMPTILRRKWVIYLSPHDEIIRTLPQVLIKRCTGSLRILSTGRFTPIAMEHLDARNEHHRNLITRKVDTYFATRQRVMYLQKQSSEIATELVHQRQLVKGLKGRLSRETAKFDKALQLQQKKENDLRLEIARANQRIQRRLRHVRISASHQGLPSQLAGTPRHIDVKETPGS